MSETDKYPSIYIVILNWNSYTDIFECISSLNNITYPNYKIVIVDNASDENIINKIEAMLDKTVHIIKNHINLGFSGGNNVGIKYALANNADFVLLLNNDTIVEIDFLDEMIKTAFLKPKAGIIGPLIAFYSNKESIWSAYGFVSKIKSSGFTRMMNKNINLVKKDKECNFLSGCCLLVRRDVIEKIGLLDEKYFLYLEDTDFCWRTTKAGFKIVLAAKSKIYHKVSASTARENSLMPLYYAVRNRLYFAKKNFGVLFYLSYWYLILTMKIKLLTDQQKVKKRAIFTRAISDFNKNIMGQAF